MTRSGITCQVHLRYDAAEEGNVVLCFQCKRGCHAISCSRRVYRTDLRAKRVLIRVCNDCYEAEPQLFSETPPREAITAGTHKPHGRIYRTRP